MKRMSDVFELPVDHNKLEVYGCNHAATYSEAEIHAAHAINHVDALADALFAMLVDYSYENRIAANNALSAYRGEK